MLRSPSFCTDLNFIIFLVPIPWLSIMPQGALLWAFFWVFWFCFFLFHFQSCSVTSVIQVLRPRSYRGLCNGTCWVVHGKLSYNILFPCFSLLCSIECVMRAFIRHKSCILGEHNRKTQNVTQSVKFKAMLKMCGREVGILRRGTLLKE